jgi:hypothetical protein
MAQILKQQQEMRLFKEKQQKVLLAPNEFGMNRELLLQAIHR